MDDLQVPCKAVCHVPCYCAFTSITLLLALFPAYILAWVEIVGRIPPPFRRVGSQSSFCFHLGPNTQFLGHGIHLRTGPVPYGPWLLSRENMGRDWCWGDAKK